MHIFARAKRASVGIFSAAEVKKILRGRNLLYYRCTPNVHLLRFCLKMNLRVHGLILALVVSVTFANERLGNTESRVEQTLQHLRPAKVLWLFSQFT